MNVFRGILESACLSVSNFHSFAVIVLKLYGYIYPEWNLCTMQFPTIYSQWSKDNLPLDLKNVLLN